MTNLHTSVLLEESIKYLDLKDTSVVVDATLGYGGHSSEILKRIKRGFLFAFDQDKNAIEFSSNKLNSIAHNYEIINNNFVNLKQELQKRDIDKVDAILFDLGVSSPQLDESKRGFSFHNDAKLDMRMDQSNKLTAYEVINKYPLNKLIQIFKEYGEEKYATSIAKNIVSKRNEKEIITTLDLVEIIKKSVPEKYKRDKHPARKVFQAIRIEVNNELEVFEKAVKQALELVTVNGRICVITFHSLEDKICKKIFKENSEVSKELINLPIIPEKYQPKFKMIANIEPGNEELEINNRARSARLRVIEKIRE